MYHFCKTANHAISIEYIKPSLFLPHLFVILIIIILHEANGAHSVRGFVVPGVVQYATLHETLQSTAARQVIWTWTQTSVFGFVLHIFFCLWIKYILLSSSGSEKSAGQFNAFIFQKDTLRSLYSNERPLWDHCFKSSLSHRLTEKQTPLTLPVQQWPDLQHIQTYQLFRGSDVIFNGQIKTSHSMKQAPFPF